MNSSPPVQFASDICLLSALEMARLIRSGQLSSRDAVSAHLDQIAAVNPSVNAIVTLVGERAMQRALALDELLVTGESIGPLHGLPIAHKDLQPTAGIRTTFGSRIFQDFIPQEDSLLVERVGRAGGIAVGKTNTPEFGAGSQTFNEVFGATRNPYDLTRTCGGSSGGAATALACHMLPIADGSDIGGSLRNPASFCNVVGLRPSPGRVPVWPGPLAWFTLGVEGPMARTVADVAFFLSAIAGPDRRSPIALPDPDKVFAAPLGRDFKGVRIAWWKDLGGLPFDPQVRQAINGQRSVFDSLGCIVEEAEPDFSGADEVFKVLRAWAFSARLDDLAQKHPGLLKATILQELERANRLTARDIGEAEVKRAEIYHRVRQFMERYEFFVLPVSQVLPFDVQQHYVAEIGGVAMTSYVDWMKSCYYISTVGNPALSVPCEFSAEGLPVGIQIVGRHNADWEVLQMGFAFEQARNLPQRVPPVALK